MRIDAPLITGSLSYNGTSLQDLSTYATTSSVDNLIQKTGSYALTGSNYFSGSQTISGSITATGNITAVGNLTAQTLVVQTITSSVDFVTGSTRFGSIQANTHEFTGSFGVTGSATFSTTVTATSLKSDGASAEGLISIERDTVSTNTVIGSLNFTNNNAATTYGRVRGGRNSAGDGYVSLGTGVGDNLYALEGGNVGIGTTAPSATLHTEVNSSTWTSKIINTNTSTNNAGLLIKAGVNSGNEILLAQKANGTSVFLVDASGYVGIGTTAPNSFLDIQGASAKASGASTGYWHSAIIDTTSAAAGVGGGLQFMGYKTGTAAFGFFGAIAGIKENGTAGNEQGALTFYSSVSAASGLTEKMRIGSDGTKYLGTYNTSRLQINPSGEAIYQYTNNYYIYGFYNDANSLNIESAFAGNIIFRTGAQTTSSSPTTTSERMRIGSGGEIVAGSTSIQTGVRLHLYSSGTTSATYPLATRNSATVDTMYVRSDGYGYLLSAGWAYGSDIRLKENIVYIESGIDKVLALKPVKFDYIDGVKDNLGWIAQEVQEVIPEAVGCVSETNDQLTLKSDYIVPYLVKAVQELSAKIDLQQEEIEILKNK